MPKYKGKVTLTYEFDGIEAESKQDAFIIASDKAWLGDWLGEWDYEIEEDEDRGGRGMTFEEANEKVGYEAFGFDFHMSLCATCKHKDTCNFSDYEAKLDEPSVISKCNWYEENEK